MSRWGIEVRPFTDDDRATAFAPASIGNVGPGFDVLGLAVEGLGDRVSVGISRDREELVSVEGRDAEHIPHDPGSNAAVIAARALFKRFGVSRSPRVWITKGLPLAGGLGGSAASSVAGALAAAAALHVPAEPADIVAAALEGEAHVAGHHLDNIAPCVFGGLTLVRSVDPPDIVSIPVKADWWLALVTPAVRVETKAARAILKAEFERAGWVSQMANTAGLLWAFATGDGPLASRSLVDHYAEPRRASLIPHFEEVKAAAVDAGALGCSISGSGPTVFALAPDEAAARACAGRMQRAFAEIASTAHVGRISRTGAIVE